MSVKSYLQNQIDAASPRERILMALAAATMAVVIAWLGVIEPLTVRSATATHQLTEAQALNLWLNENAPRMFANARGTKQAGRRAPTLAILDADLTTAGIKPLVTRLEALDGDFLLRIEGIQFTRFMGWLNAFQMDYAANVAMASLTTTESSNGINVILQFSVTDDDV